MPVRITGDWQAISKYKSNLANNAEALRGRISTKAAKLYLEAVRARFDRQEAQTALDELSTPQGEEKYDTQVEADPNTPKFKDKLTTVKIGDSQTFAGAPSDVPFNDEISMAEMAILLEYGDRNHPGHPIFGPARMDVMNKIAPHIEDEIKKAMMTSNY